MRYPTTSLWNSSSLTSASLRPIDDTAVSGFGAQVRGRSPSPLRYRHGRHRGLCSVENQPFSKFLRLHEDVGLEAGSREWRDAREQSGHGAG